MKTILLKNEILDGHVRVPTYFGHAYVAKKSTNQQKNEVQKNVAKKSHTNSFDRDYERLYNKVHEIIASNRGKTR